MPAISSWRICSKPGAAASLREGMALRLSDGLERVLFTTNVAKSLDERYAVVKSVLSLQKCRLSAVSYAADELFRSRIRRGSYHGGSRARVESLSPLFTIKVAELE